MTRTYYLHRVEGSVPPHAASRVVVLPGLGTYLVSTVRGWGGDAIPIEGQSCREIASRPWRALSEHIAAAIHHMEEEDR